MTRYGLILLCGLALAGCDSTNPLTGGPDDDGGGGGVPTDPNDIPAALAGNLASIGYDADDEELTVEIQLDSDTVSANYTRNPTLDIPGYVAFTSQDDPLDRMYTALVADSFDGGVTAGVVADGGQFNRFFGGGFYKRNHGTLPTTGLASYAGTYAGVTNVSGNSGEILTPPPGTDPANLPSESARVQGDIFLNVDFAQNKVNGAVSNRSFVDDGEALDTVVLIATDITEEGTFNGVVEFEDQTGIGTYGGVFGGTDATAVGGVVHLTEFDADLQNEQEYGVFVLTRCGLDGDDSACDDVDDLD
jgi:hypothetical protein